MLFKHRQQKGIYKPEQTASLAKDESSLSELKDSGIAVHRMLAIASSCSWFSAWFEVVSWPLRPLGLHSGCVKVYG